MLKLQQAEFLTPHGNRVVYAIRPDTSDWNTCNAITAVGDEYHLPQGLSGWALDVGAHIGACIVALLVDNPDLRCVAIEALPENVALIRENLALNGVTDRAMVFCAAAGDGTEQRIGYGEVTDPTLIHEFIGNMNAPAGSREIYAPGLSLSGVLDLITYDLSSDGNLGIRIVWAKFDCESCEYPFLSSPEVGRIDHIEGEVHSGWQRLVDILEPTHIVTGPGRDFGPFTAVRRG